MGKGLALHSTGANAAVPQVRLPPLAETKRAYPAFSSAADHKIVNDGMGNHILCQVSFCLH